MSEKKKRLFYYSEGTCAFVPLDCLDEFIHNFDDLDDGDQAGIIIKRIDMTDEEFKNLLEG